MKISIKQLKRLISEALDDDERSGRSGFDQMYPYKWLQGKSTDEIKMMMANLDPRSEDYKQHMGIMQRVLLGREEGAVPDPVTGMPVWGRKVDVDQLVRAHKLWRNLKRSIKESIKEAKKQEI